MELDVRSDEYRNRVFEKIFREDVPETKKEWLRRLFVEHVARVSLSEQHEAPWKPLTVYEHVQKSINDSIKPYNENPELRRRLDPTGMRMLEVSRGVLRLLNESHVIHLSKTPLRELYLHEHTPHPYEETLKLPFSKVFLEFGEPLVVDAISTFGVKKDYLVCILCEELDDSIFLHLLWDDMSISHLEVNPKRLPLFGHAYCGLPENPDRPDEYKPCAWEILVQRHPEMAQGTICPGTIDVEARDKFPCLHNAWRARIVNLFINILTLLNAKNLEYEEVKTAKKRVRRASKEGTRLPSSYRRVVLDWFTPTRASGNSEGDGSRSVSGPYFRRGHFRQYRPGKFTWVQPHLCRADLKEKNPSKKIYRA